MGLSVDYLDRVTTGPSPNIWGRAPIFDRLYRGDGVHLFDKFENLSGTLSGAAGRVNGWYIYAGTGDSAAVGAQYQGSLKIATAATDNNEVWLTTGTGTALGTCKIGAALTAAVGLETRLQWSSVADHGSFIGLATAGTAANNGLVDDTGALKASTSLVGFHVDTAGPTSVDAVYQDSAGSAVVLSAGVQTIAAATDYNFGLLYNPVNTTMYWYINNVKVASVDISTLSDFPDADALAPLIGVKAGEAGAKALDISFIRHFSD